METEKYGTLQINCKAYSVIGTHLSAKKRDLVERLEAYDSNKSIGKEPEETTTKESFAIPKCVG